MNPIDQFNKEKAERIEGYKNDSEMKALSLEWVEKSFDRMYTYNFEWMGRPVIQTPQDLLAMQELLWKIKPDLVIETGIAHGGSLVFYASILELIGNGKVVGVDIDIRDHNRTEIEKHPMFKRIKMIQGSSIDLKIVSKVAEYVKPGMKVLVTLDSNHTHEHVLKELELYSPFVTKGSCLVVFDSIVEDISDSLSADRPWGKGNNPKTALYEFLKQNHRFKIDNAIDSKLFITFAPDGFLKCIED